MFSSLKIAIASMIIIAAMGTGFYLYYRMSEAEKAVLIANQAKLELAVKTNESTIKLLRANAERMAEANINLQAQLSDAETLASAEKDAINTEDLTKSSIANPDQVEKKINEDYAKSNRDLERISGGQ